MTGCSAVASAEASRTRNSWSNESTHAAAHDVGGTGTPARRKAATT